MKLYWRIQKNGKWTWTPAVFHVEIAANGKRRMYIDNPYSHVYKNQCKEEEE